MQHPAGYCITVHLFLSFTDAIDKEEEYIPFINLIMSKNAVSPRFMKAVFIVL